MPNFSVQASQAPHINKTRFIASLFTCDIPSLVAPLGCKKLILIPKKVAENKLHTIIGCGINMDPTGFYKHCPTNKVGCITEAFIDSCSKFWISGFLWTLDFPYILIKYHSQKYLNNKLEMSVEFCDGNIQDSNNKIWTFTNLTFIGAAIVQIGAFSDTSFQLF